MVAYTTGHNADHWCQKGHILLCLDSELYTELENGEVHLLKVEMSYKVSDNAMAHRSYTSVGCEAFYR